MTVNFRGNLFVTAVLTAFYAFAGTAEIAGKEFAKYHRLVTGREVPSGAVRFTVDAKISETGNDAYSIRSEGNGVSITGSNGRSLLYGVYDFLERRAGCRWFWDGDVVPKRADIDLTGLDIREEARFEWRGLRYFAHRGLTRFQAEHWGLEDWKKEIDWCLKKRLNTFMLRIGQDDLFQKTFPETCAYPDPSKPLPGAGKGYDNRSLFWPLDFRGRLRTELQRYARERGMDVPEDFGTMTHWYSRTPEDYLAKKNPTFLPQATRGYSEKNGLVWDIREKKWADEYWKLTHTAVREYGGGETKLLHTIGLGERNCYTNRTDNFNLKLQALNTFISRARRDYPNAKILLAGWDFYFTWKSEEVRDLVSRLDPEHTIIWDYEGDVKADHRTDFTQWGVVGKFPYTYSVFLAYEAALDMRADYPLIEERQKIVQNDAMCKGFIFWPESSHTDTLLLEYFAANAWKKGGESVKSVLPRFCDARYGRQSAAMRDILERCIPVSYTLGWGGNYCTFAVRRSRNRWGNEISAGKDGAGKLLRDIPGILRDLAKIDCTDPFLRRDTVDAARMLTDRAIVALNVETLDAYDRWLKGDGDGSGACRGAAAMAELAELMAKLLAQHTDYSLWESYERLNAVERVRNPDFPQVLLDNASCDYCASHQYECAKYWYLPALLAERDEIASNVKSGKKVKLRRIDPSFRQKLLATPLKDMRPRDKRSGAELKRIVAGIADRIEACGYPKR